MMEAVTDEYLLPRRVVPQPQPHLSPGGDCAACVVAGLLGMGVPEIYDELYEGKPQAPSRPETMKALHRAMGKGLLKRLVTTTPTWPTSEYYLAFGPAGYLHNLEWFAYATMAMEAGYYGIASVVFHKTGNGGQCPPPTDHLVLLCGVREVRVEVREGAYRIDQQVLVSCSAKSSPAEEWVEVRDFLTNRGGYNAIWAKPA
jgi:hypothetical protein